MEYPPNPPGSLQGLGYFEVPPSQPASIQIISVFAIVFGSLVVLCDVLGVVGGIFALVMGHSGFMAQQPQMQSTSLNIFNAIQAVIGLGLSGVLLAGGIGGVQVRPWARKLLIKWAVANIAFQLLSGALAIYFTLSVTLPAMQAQMNRQGRGASATMVTYFSAGGVIGVIVFMLIACILPICVLIFWRRPNVVAAFETPPQSFV